MKKLSILLGTLLAILVSCVIVLVIFVNPNQFKPLIVNQVKDKTGLDLVITGDISWQFFPSIGFQLGQTELKNPQGYSSANMFKVDEVGIDVSLFGLLDHELNIGNVRLEGAEVHLETLKNGQSNLDSFKAPESASSQATKSKSTPSQAKEEPSDTVKTDDSSQPWELSVQGVDIVNGVLDIQDQQTKTFTKLYDLQLSLDNFAVNQWSNVTFGAKGSHNQQTFAVSGTTELNVSNPWQDSTLRDMSIKASYSDKQVQIKQAEVTAESLSLTKENLIKYQVSGKANDMALSADGQASMTIDEALNHISLTQFNVNTQLDGKSVPNAPLKLQLAAKGSYDLGKKQAKLNLDTLDINEMQWQGKVNAKLDEIPKITFSLSSDNVDLDPFLVSPEAQSQAKPKTVPAKTHDQSLIDQKAAEPDLSALSGLDVSGSVKMKQFKAANAKLHNVDINMAIHQGKVLLNHFDADLYDGHVNAKATLDGNDLPATYKASGTIKHVEALPLLKDLTKKQWLAGNMNADFSVQGAGLTPEILKPNLEGSLDMAFKDGSINGVNVAQLIRTTYAKLKGQKVEDDAPQKTDFSSLTAKVKLDQGVANVTSLHLQSPLLRIQGEGSANYLEETMDMLVRTSLVSSLKGQGGKSIDELRDVTIPLNIHGQWAKPKFKLVFDDVLKQKARKEVDRGLEKLDGKIKDERTKKAVNGLIKGLFN
ncbi:AsmA family protein [Vibrio palustris]|uniref:Putative assembly protein n=1 Tax=Vibrio palustris TaxID=1918946 RepID=A0A1R4B1I7_9VIBR|nr:AsmA family protein [Vibrio palustris]SJL82771.1 putative assembly protein [Vibrio palustris]